MKKKILFLPLLALPLTFVSCSPEAGSSSLPGSSASAPSSNTPSTSQPSSSTEPEAYVELGEIVSDKEKLHQHDTASLTCDGDVTWSVSDETMASITEDGVLTTKDKDGLFIVTATSVKNEDYSVSKLFEVSTLSAEELATKLYDWGVLYNYTITWTGEFLDEEGISLTQAEYDAIVGAGTDASLLYEDLVTKGNLLKITQDAFYWKYGLDGYGNVYEGGSYNSPDGYFYDYDIVNGQAVKGSVDYYSAMLGWSDYKMMYSSDLSFFVEDEFKVEDSHLELNETYDALVYDAKKDENEFREDSLYDFDYSIPLALFTAVDSFYSEQMITLGLDEKCTGTIVYEEDRIHCEFVFPGLSVDATHSFDYKAIFDITDPGTTVIPGIAELIAADREALE